MFQENSNMEQSPQPAAAEPVKSTGCCPPFDPAQWDEKEIVWDNKLFVKDHILSFLHIPLTLNGTVARNGKKIIRAHADITEYLMLIDEKSKWGADVFIEVSKNVPKAKNITMSGTFLTKVFDGPYKYITDWAAQMEDYVKSKGKAVDKIYYFYTTCPNCAKVYGKNYVVLFAQVSNIAQTQVPEN
jgi:hypothetical protein